MRRFIKTLFALIFSVAIGLLIQHDPGYLLLSYGTWTVEMPLWLATSFAVLGLAFLLIVLKFIGWFSSLAYKIRHWHSQYILKTARAHSMKGFILLAEGNWRKAEKLLIKGVKHNRHALLNYLGAAVAAQELGDNHRRDDYLRVAHREYTVADTAIAITQAKLQIEQGQLEQALAILERLHRQQPQHEHVMKLLKFVYLKLNAWDDLLALLPQLKKNKLILADEFDNLRYEIYLHKLNKLEQRKTNENDWLELWQSIPSQFHHETAYLKRFIPVCLAHQTTMAKLAEQLLRKALQNQWDDQLIKFYGLIQEADTREQLSHCEMWLKQYPQNSALLLTLGRLCLHSQLWGKAEQYLSASLSSQPLPETYFELGTLHLKNGDQTQSLTYFQQGLEKASKIEIPKTIGSSTA